ncbi:TVP38/TMEM64 family protein [Jeotgalibaca sp. A127]|uniref:TVP38/TMEM64 family protein n=1 Tax=Jeotgalibaca sp. A127 TaxID=3457324 RepID=UPI003FD2AB37
MTEKQIIETNRNVIRLFIVMGILLSVGLAYYTYQIGYNEILSGTQALIFRMGILGPIIFILLQMSQVIYPIVPGGIILIIAPLLFGNLWGFILSFIGVTLGSIANFFLARRFGKTFVRAFVQEETYQKYYAILTKGKRFDIFLGVAFAFPGFPDDFLCMLAGITAMTFNRFMKIYLWTKPLTLFVYGIGGASITDWFMRYLGL